MSAHSAVKGLNKPGEYEKLDEKAWHLDLISK